MSRIVRRYRRILRHLQHSQTTAAFAYTRDGRLMSALTAGTRVRTVSRRPPVGGAEGVVVEWRGVAFQVELDGLGTHFFEPEELEKVRR